MPWSGCSALHEVNPDLKKKEKKKVNKQKNYILGYLPDGSCSHFHQLCLKFED